MADHPADASRPLHWHTRLITDRPRPPAGFQSLAPAVYRGSTVVFDRVSEVVDDWRPEAGYNYGLYGTPTTLELGLRIAALERARHTFVVPGGQAALALVSLAYCRSGAHVLVPANVYGPHAEIGQDLLSGLGIEVERYDPMAGAGIAALLRPTTALVWCESPGSITMEVQDVPAIVAAAHAHGIPVALDNTYAAGVLFDAFAHGVDVSVQALTKYVGGHSDLLLGTVSVGHDAAYETVGRMWRLIGMAVSPDDCALAMRGLATLGVRLERLERSTLAVARWLAAREEVADVLHPALPGCPGHEHWRRHFSGSASVFSIVFHRDWTAARVTRFVEALRLFALGYSWGGVNSLVMTYPDLTRVDADRRARLVRFNVGLEAPDDLVADLEQALATAQAGE
ncbi:MAG: cystathionine beta-lyase [Vicinamibacterales bacterium]